MTQEQKKNEIYAYVNGKPLEFIDSDGLEQCPGGVWDIEAGDFGISLAFGAYIGSSKITYVCRSRRNIVVHTTQTCIGGGPIVVLGIGVSVIGTTYGVTDSSGLEGWSQHQLQSTIGPINIQAPLNDPGGSASVGKAVGVGMAYTSCYTRIDKAAR